MSGITMQSRRAGAPGGRLRRSLRASTLDGSLHASMVGFGESYFAAFALFLSATPFQVGLLTTVPILCGSLFQVIASALARRVGDKLWVLASAGAQAGVLAVIAFLAATGRSDYHTLLALVCAYWALALGISPAWNSWIGRMIPPRLRSRYFGRRNVPIHVTLFFSLIAAGLVVDAGERGDWGPAAGFALAFSIAAAGRFASTFFLGLQHDPGSRQRGATLPLRRVVADLRVEPYGRLILLLVLMTGSVHISAAYFTPFMLGDLGLSYARYTLLSAVVFAARVLASPYWGEIARLYGNRRALQVSATLIIPMAGLWVLSDSYAYLLGLQLLAGFAWAGFELSAMLNLLDCTDDSNRATVLTLYNTANGVMVVAGSLLGGAVMLAFGERGYHVIFLLSSLARAVCMLSFAKGLGRKRAGGEHTFSNVFLRVLTFRPGIGPTLRPVVLPEGDEDRGGV